MSYNNVEIFSQRWYSLDIDKAHGSGEDVLWSVEDVGTES